DGRDVVVGRDRHLELGSVGALQQLHQLGQLRVGQSCAGRPAPHRQRHCCLPPNRSTSTPCRSPRSLTIRRSSPSLSITVRTTHAPARMTSARFGWSPTIDLRASASRDRYSSIWRSISSRSRTLPCTTSGSYAAI